MIHTKPRYTIEEAARLLGIGRAWLYRQISAGALTVRKDGRRSFVTADEIDRYAAGDAPATSSRVANSPLAARLLREATT